VVHERAAHAAPGWDSAEGVAEGLADTVIEPETSVSSLIEGARRDLAYADALLRRGGDRLLCSRSSRSRGPRAVPTNATFAAVDENAQSRSGSNTHRGYTSSR